MQAGSDARDSLKALSDGLVGEVVSRPREANGCVTIPISSSASISSSSSFSVTGSNFIEHRVSKMDTLAGIAIKYGVEVGDIRRMNGLVTDLQMFAHRSLQIPLPGRHPPSPVMGNGSSQNEEKTPRHQPPDIVVGSLQSLNLKPSPRRVSPAMCSLQGYYGLTKVKKSRLPIDIEMSVYKSGKTLLLEDNELIPGSPASDQVHSRPLKSKDPVRRSEILLKEEGTRRAGNGLALRPKPGCRTDLEEGFQSPALGSDSLLGDAAIGVRKSSSASNLSKSEIISSIWPTNKWSLKPDVIARPILDGLPKPITAWRNKAAID